MKNTKDVVRDYFNSANKFVQSWLDYLKSISPNTGNNPEAEKAFEDYENLTKNFMSKIENFIEDQIGQAMNATPEEIQQQNINDLNQLEEAYKQSYEMVLSIMEKEKEYLQTDDYLNYIKANKENVNSIYNTTLDSVTKVFDSYSKLFQNLK